MMSRCVVLMAMAGLLAAAVSSCAGPECSINEDHCVGNVQWSCQVGETAGGYHWESKDCGDAAQCLNGTCFAKPLVLCTAAEEGYSKCLAGRYTGRCTEDGAYAWDMTSDCTAKSGQACVSGKDLAGAPDGPSLAMCAYTDSTCPPGTSQPTCHNDILTDCNVLGYQAMVKDCAAERKVCRNGACQ
jgi:hypothetical protein